MVESHPFDTDKMLFMDWRDNYCRDKSAMRESNNKYPTFLYAMPFSENRIFFEETSLVARPAVGFKDLQERLVERLKKYNIKVVL